MVVAVVAVRVVQVAINEVVRVVAMRYGFVAVAVMIRGADVRVSGADGDTVFIDVVAVRMVQVAIVQVIDVAFVFDGGVTAIRAVLVFVVGVVRFVAATAAVVFAHE